MLKKIIILFFALLGCSAAYADIYKYTDENGNITFTNTPMKGAQRILVEPAFRPGAKTSSGKSPSQTNTPSPGNFPRVDSSTQKERDTNRRRILEEEMGNEQRQLNDARQKLQNAESTRTAEEKTDPAKYLERLQRMRENIMLHEKNLAALQSELSRVK